MNKLWAGLVLLVMIMSGLSSCKLGKKPTRRKIFIDTMTHAGLITVLPDSEGAVVIADTAAPVLNAAKLQLIEMLQPVWQQQIGYTSFEGKAKMHYEGKDQNVDFTATFRLKKDSVIWASITALGGLVPVARAYITPDSIRLINYLQKEAYLMPMSKASELLPATVDFAALQNLIIGNVLRTMAQVTDITDFGGAWSLQMEDNEYLEQLTYNKADSTMRSSQLRSKASDGPAAVVQYGNYEPVAGRRFANSRAINIINKGEQYYLDMNFNNASFDQALEFPFSVPKKYTVK